MVPARHLQKEKDPVPHPPKENKTVLPLPPQLQKQINLLKKNKNLKNMNLKI